MTCYVLLNTLSLLLVVVVVVRVLLLLKAAQRGLPADAQPRAGALPPRGRRSLLQQGRS